MSRKYEINMCEGALFSKILKCAFPMVLANLLQLLYNAVDIIVVGRYAGETALAAVGSTSALINLIINLLIGVSVGASIVTSQYIGAQNRDKTQDAVHTSILLAVIGGIFFSVIGFSLTRPLLVLTGSPDNVINKADTYMRIYFLGTPAFMVSNFGSAILRSVGDTKRPLYIFSLSGILNAVLNLVFVIKFNMDVDGVAIATIISQYISAVLIIYTLTKTDGYVTLYIKELRIKKDVFCELLKKGLPVGIQSLTFNISNIIIQSSINSFGSVVIAGNSAAANIESFLYTALNTISVVATTFVAQNYGAKKYKRIDRILLVCLGLVMAIGVIADVIFIPIQRNLLEIYAPGNDAAINAGMVRFKYIFDIYFLCGIMDVLSGVIRGIGKTTMTMIGAIIGVVGFRIVWIFAVFSRFKTLETLFLSYAVSWILTSSIFLLSYFILRKKLFINEKESL